jgi:hypothetical protein
MSSFVYLGHEDIFYGHLHFLPGLYAQGGMSILESAITGVSYLAAFNKWRSCDLFISAREYHGIALAQLQRALSSSTLASGDECFATILVLALFLVRYEAYPRTSNG